MAELATDLETIVNDAEQDSTAENESPLAC